MAGVHVEVLLRHVRRLADGRFAEPSDARLLEEFIDNQIPDEAGSGMAKVTVRMVDWPDHQVLPATVQIPIED